MASPQLENGYTSIANEIIEALSRYRIPGEQMQCLFVVLRKTYGWNKKCDEISLSQFVEFTGLKKQHAYRAISGLIEKNIILVTKKDYKTGSSYRFNKNFDSWIAYPKKVTVTKKGDQPYPKKVTPPIKDNIKQFSSEIFSFCENFIQWSAKEHKAKAPKNTQSLLNNSCDSIDKLIRLDGFTQDYVFSTIRWAAKDSFWSNQVVSLAGLRKVDESGLSKFQKIAAKYDSQNKIIQINGKEPASLNSGMYKRLP